MPRYHINPETGNPGVCGASVKCPFGDIEKEHFDSKAEARENFEKTTKDAALKAWKKKVSPVTNDSSRPTSSQPVPGHGVRANNGHGRYEVNPGHGRR